MKCVNCGSENNDNSRFCSQCGMPANAYTPEPERVFTPTTPVQPVQPIPPMPPIPPIQPVQPIQIPRPTEPVPTSSRIMAIVSLVLGIISLASIPFISVISMAWEDFGFNPLYYVPLIEGIAGIILSTVAKAKGYRGGLIIAGLVCSIIATVIWGFVMTIQFGIYIEDYYEYTYRSQR